MWLRTNMLRKQLGDDAFRRITQRELTPKNPTQAGAYGLIWALNPSGVLSLNLDSLAADNNLDAKVATAIEPTKYGTFLLSSRPFLFQPHGRLDNPDSWVLDATTRNRLLGSPEYRRFVIGLLTSRRLVFVGVGPRDLAIEALLLDDVRQHINGDGLHHFWITDTTSAEDVEWARSFNVHPILYEPGEHQQVEAILTGLSEFQPRSPSPPIAYEGASIDPSDLPPDEDLMRRTDEEIRQRLNAAMRFLATKDANAVDDISRLLADYPRSTHLAWLVDGRSPTTSRLWSHRVTRRLGEGAFGQVWEAVDMVDGQRYAVKILHKEVLHSEGFLEAFRRGVHAMRILSNSNVKGMCRLHEAYDIPACIFMEFIDGPTLEDMIESRQLSSAEDKLSVLVRVARIILRGHNLPDRVLHRDLKPANIIARNYYTTGSIDDVVVLDFDLSWYEGAMGKSMVTGAARLHNYIAPEQQSKSAYSSRHTSVDVFGLGMLALYVLTQRHPALNEQMSSDFESRLVNDIQFSTGEFFPGISHYLASIIVSASTTAQEDRPSLPALIDQFVLALESARNGTVPTGSVLLSLVQTRLASMGWSFDASPDWHSARDFNARFGSAQLRVHFDIGSAMRVSVSAASSGSSDRSKVKQKLTSARQQIDAVLRRSALRIDAPAVDGYSGGFRVSAAVELDSEVSATDLEELVCLLDRAGKLASAV